MRVLIVEDDTVSRLVLQGALGQLGHECLVAEDGQQGWEIFQCTLVDVVISDWVMPNMNGIELCRHVRTLTDRPYTYFIFLTSRGGQERLDEGLLAGTDDYLLKPLNPDDLKARLIVAERITRFYQQARERESHYRLLAENSNDFIWMSNLTGELSYASPAVFNLMGYTPTEALTLAMERVFEEDDLRRFGTLVANQMQAFQTGLTAPFVFEAQLKRKDGARFWAEVSVSLSLNSHGQAIGRQGIVRDITQRRNAEEVVRQREAYFRQLLENSSDIISVLEAEDNFFYWSPAGDRLLGGWLADLAGQLDWERIHPDDRALLRDALTSVRQQPLGAQVKCEYRARHISGLWLTLETVFCNRLADVAVAGLIGNTRDITERKQTEEALAQLNRELRRSNQDLENFAHMASHDLQEPLRMITNYLALLERRYAAQLDGDAREFIGFATDGAKRMSVLIRSLLEYSRVGAHGLKLTTAAGANVVQRALENLSLAIEDRGATITVDPLPSVQGDVVLLTQLFQNLLSNALKFCTGHPPVIHIGGQATTPPTFFVKDNGIGIAPEHFERIFQIFQRLHTRAEYEGTGIGLAVCQRIVERHGGKMWVESTVGEGTTFYFTLPLANTV